MISKCLLHKFRQKLLQKGRALTLPQLREIAWSMKESEKQTLSIKSASGEVSSEVNSVSGRNDYKGNTSTRNVQCFCCGNVGHNAVMITDAQREGNSAESVMEMDILRLCVKLIRSKLLAVEVEELEDHLDQVPEERIVLLTM